MHNAHIHIIASPVLQAVVDINTENDQKASTLRNPICKSNSTNLQD